MERGGGWRLGASAGHLGAGIAGTARSVASRPRPPASASWRPGLADGWPEGMLRLGLRAWFLGPAQRELWKAGREKR